MDIIKCVTCNTPETEWTHGAFPDEGGALAHTHAMQNPTHVVSVGDDKQLIAMAKSKPAKKLVHGT